MSDQFCYLVMLQGNIDEYTKAPMVYSDQDCLYKSESGKSCSSEMIDAIGEFNTEDRSIWKPMHMQPIYRSHGYFTKTGIGRARSNAYIKEAGFVDLGTDIFRRGLCLPSDNKMTAEQQDIVIDIIHHCFR